MRAVTAASTRSRDRLRLCIAAVAVAAAAALGGCDLAPVYAPPVYVLPVEWRGQRPFAPANPRDTLPRGPWWNGFNDPTLDQLERRLTAENPTIAALYEQYVQARDSAAIARSGLYPQFSASGSSGYNKESRNSLFKNPQSNQFTTQGNNVIQAGATWQPDFWDRIRNAERQQARLAQSSAALVANARLSLQALLASSYIEMRGLDAQDAIYRRAVASYETSVKITQLRLAGLIGTGLDVARAQAQLGSTRALQSANQASRTLLEHTIAVLVGANPSTFSIPPTQLDGLAIPAVPTGVPSQLLERRPDIAAAEREMAAANASIGITRAAFYPNITLSATGGFEDSGFNLASLPNALWTIGASAVLPLFEGGLRRAELQQSWSQFAQTRDNYRATVLTAFQQVEDQLTLVASLASQTQSQQQAVNAADRAQDLTQRLYVGGLVTYLDVVVAQETALVAGLASVQAKTARFQASVNLISALGGGWNTENLPSEKDVLPFNPLNVLRHNREPRSDGTGQHGYESSEPAP